MAKKYDYCFENVIDPSIYIEEEAVLAESGIYVENRKKIVSLPHFHYHNYYEILYYKEGTRRLEINEKELHLLDSSHIALLNPHIIHHTSTINETAQNKIMIYISHEAMKKIVEFTSPQILDCFESVVLELDAYSKKILNYMFASLIDASRGGSLYPHSVSVIVANILLILNDCYENNVLSSKNKKTISAFSKNKYENALIQFLTENFKSPLTNEEIAAHLFVSNAHLNRIAKATLGMTPHKYLLKLKIIHACELIQEGNITFSEISSMCGFTSLSSFSRAFKSETGVTPREYKDNHNSIMRSASSSETSDIQEK